MDRGKLDIRRGRYQEWSKEIERGNKRESEMDRKME